MASMIRNWLQTKRNGARGRRSARAQAVPARAHLHSSCRSAWGTLALLLPTLVLGLVVTSKASEPALSEAGELASTGSDGSMAAWVAVLAALYAMYSYERWRGQAYSLMVSVKRKRSIFGRTNYARAGSASNCAVTDAPSSHTFSRLILPSRNSHTWSIRNVIRRPFPEIPRNSPGTVPVQSCSMTAKASP